VVALISPKPWSPVPRNANRVWWEDRVVDESAFEEGLRVPTLIRIEGDDPPPSKAALLLSRLSRGPLTVVLTTADQPSPFDDRALLRESWGHAYQVNHVLRRL
jgi:hypothetical protein